MSCKIFRHNNEKVDFYDLSKLRLAKTPDMATPGQKWQHFPIYMHCAQNSSDRIRISAAVDSETRTEYGKKSLICVVVDFGALQRLSGWRHDDVLATWHQHFRAKRDSPNDTLMEKIRIQETELRRSEHGAKSKNTLIRTPITDPFLE